MRECGKKANSWRLSDKNLKNAPLIPPWSYFKTVTVLLNWIYYSIKRIIGNEKLVLIFYFGSSIAASASHERVKLQKFSILDHKAYWMWWIQTSLRKQYYLSCECFTSTGDTSQTEMKEKETSRMKILQRKTIL